MRAKTGVSSVKPVRDRLQAPQRPSRTTTRRHATSLARRGTPAPRPSLVRRWQSPQSSS
jgi:hypothetical protein